MPSAGFLRTLVIGLGVAIFVALGFIVYGVVTIEPGSGESSRFQGLTETVDLGQPAGSEIEEVQQLGDRLTILVKGGGVPDRLLVIDGKTGAVAQTIWVSDPPSR
ncbi:MAG: hypothetical protein FJX59_05710 [Alphaproteobacteria bacterium]|nr:hypothetical protein [Alphaproteobacteria bacterium]